MRTVRLTKLISLSVICLLTSCAGGGDQPEVPPTTILGSSIIFTYDEGVVLCKTIAGEIKKNEAEDNAVALTDLKIRCYGAMPVLSTTATEKALARFGFNSFSTVVDPSLFKEATQFASDITGTLWKPLSFETGGVTLTITDYLVEANGIGVVYTIPAAQVTTENGTAQASLEVTRADETRTIDYDYNWAPLPGPSPTPDP
jgi:hypothetical protein